MWEFRSFVMKFGETFKQIRLTRKYSIEALADERVSKSTISRFERLESDITFDKLVVLLNKMQVSIGEFIFLSEKDSEINALNQLPKFILEKDLEQLQLLMEQLWREYEKDGIIYRKVSAILIEVHYNHLVKKEIEDERLLFLTDYLFQCEVWTQFDLFILGNSIEYLPLSTSIVLTKELIKKTSLFQGNRLVFETVINILINTSLVCMKENKLSIAQELISELQGLDIDETYFFERVLIKFVFGNYLVKCGNVIEGEREVNESLQVMRLLGANKLEESFLAYYQDYIC